MVNSKYEYVRLFETPSSLLPNTYIIIRIDGRGFYVQILRAARVCQTNEIRAQSLRNAAPIPVQTLPGITLAYGVSDEFSFLFPRS